MRGMRGLLIILAVAGTLGLGFGLLFVGTVSAAGGLMSVAVDDPSEDLSFNIVVPAAAVTLAASAVDIVAEDIIDDHIDAHVRAEIDQWIPVANDLLRELESADDFVMVDVDDHGDHVRVEKRGSRVIVQVRERHGTNISIGLPLPVVRAVVRALT